MLADKTAYYLEIIKLSMIFLLAVINKIIATFNFTFLLSKMIPFIWLNHGLINFFLKIFYQKLIHHQYNRFFGKYFSFRTTDSQREF